MTQTAGTTQHRPWRPRMLSLAAALLLGVAAVVAALAFAGSVHSDENRLLRQKADEAAVVLNATLSPTEQQLATLDNTAAISTAAFRRTAAATGGQGATVLLRGSPAALHVAALVPGANGFTAGFAAGSIPATVQAAAATVLRTAGPTGTVATLPLVAAPGGGKILGFLYADSAVPGTVVYTGDLVPTQYAPVLPGTLGQAFGDIDATVYLSTVPRLDQLLISTVPLRNLPLAGTVDRQLVPVLGRQWLVEVRARGSLVSSPATSLPWIVGIGGVVFALLVGAVIEALLRRRAYAFRLVSERTAELRRSLDELAAAQETIVRQERLAAIGELASAVGHELRNPLAVIGNALFLLRSSTDPAVVDKNLGVAEREVTAASLIVSDLLDFARARAPMPSDVELDGLVDEVLGVSPPPGGVRLHRDGGSGIRVSADRDQLRQVLLNLVTNAYEAVGDEGNVGIAVERQNGTVQLRVTDSGPGIPDSAAGRLFEPFFTTKARGVGLGLAVTRRIVEAHGGRIEAGSAPEGGAMFTVTLPVLTAPRQAADHVAEAAR